MQAVKLNGELRAVSALIYTPTDRRDLLRRRLAQFELLTPRPGAMFGEELPRLVGCDVSAEAKVLRKVLTLPVVLILREIHGADQLLPAKV